MRPFLNSLTRTLSVPRGTLYNQLVLYFFVVTSIMWVMSNMARSDVVTTAVFIACGVLVSFFSKNMIVILAIGLVLSGVYKYGLSSFVQNQRENFKDKSNNEDDDEDDDDEENVDEEENEAVKPTISTGKSTPAPVVSTSSSSSSSSKPSTASARNSSSTKPTSVAADEAD